LVRATLAAATGDLVGNWSWTVWLLIPAALVLAVITALCLGPSGEPPRSHSTDRGVSRYLAQQTTTDRETP
jgi:hypothetical protein